MRFPRSLLIAAALASAPAAAAPVDDAQRALLAGGYRFERAGWIYLHAEGAPRARGFQHGYLLAPEIADGIRTTKVVWERLSAMEWGWLVERADQMLTGKIDAENRAELDGLVEGLAAAGVATTRAELVAYNGQFELFDYWWPGELKKLKEGPAKVAVRESCSAFIATGSWTRGGGVVLGHNTHMPYWMALPRIVADLAPEKGHRVLMQTVPGWIHSGTDFFVTDAGLVGAETTIGGFEGFDPEGAPEFSRMRRATQDADGIDAWVEIMKRGNNGGYANAWLLGDVNTGEIARLQLGLKNVVLDRSRDGYFAGSNVPASLRILRHETGLNETDVRRSGVARGVRWKQLLSQARGNIDVELAKRFEADHRDTWTGSDRPGSRGLCAHYEADRDPSGPVAVPNAPAGAVDAKVVDARMAKEMSFAARWGSGCGRPFDAAAFLAAQPQFDWMGDILKSRPSQPWAVFRAGDRSGGRR